MCDECSLVLLGCLLGLRHTEHTRHHHGHTSHLARSLTTSDWLILLSLYHIHLHKSLMVLSQSGLLHQDNLLVILLHLLRVHCGAFRISSRLQSHIRHNRHLTRHSCSHARHSGKGRHLREPRHLRSHLGSNCSNWLSGFRLFLDLHFLLFNRSRRMVLLVFVFLVLFRL